MNNLEDIKNRLAAATPGPWNLLPSQFPNAEQVTRYNADSGFAGFTEMVADNVAPDDAEFIAHAPMDIARLVKALEAVAGLYQGNTGDEIRDAVTEALDS